jgi:transposase
MKESVKNMEAIVREVLFRNRELVNRVSELAAEKKKLAAEKAALEVEVKELRGRLSRYEKPVKDSHNSSTPPSRENLRSQAVRRTRSLRTSGVRRTGGQPGHEGATLLMRESPDIIETHTPGYCSSCGLSLSSVEGKESETRQSIDIPLPVCPVVTNHVNIEKVCPCGKCNRGTFPAHVKPGVSYGVNLHAVTAYLSTVQHIPFKRLTGILKDLYGIEISQGTVSNILNRMRRQSRPGYEAIRQSIEKSPVAGADETGEHVNGILHWMWVFQNALATYIFQHASRGGAAIDGHFPKGLPESILVTDRHRSYFNMETAGHQICLAHLLRELLYLEELDKTQKWASSLLELLRYSIHQKKSKPLNEIDADSIRERFDALMNQDLSLLDKQFGALQKSLIKHDGHVFRFLEHADVPYDNNASERSIRPLKVKQNVSGMFKSENGANAFCQLYSIVDTARKNNMDPFMALVAVAENIITPDTS